MPDASPIPSAFSSTFRGGAGDEHPTREVDGGGSPGRQPEFLSEEHAARYTLGRMACGNLVTGYAVGVDPGTVPALALAATFTPAAGLLFGSVVGSVTRARVVRFLALFAGGVLLVLAAEALDWSGAPGSLGEPRAVGLFGLFWLGAAWSPECGRTAAGIEPRASGWTLALWRAALLGVLAWLLDGAAAAWGLVSNGPPWSPETAARLLDLSPRAFVMEVAGADWMRSVTIYEAVGTDRIPPDLRPGYAPGSATGWGRAVAVLPLVVVGSGLMGLRWKGASSSSVTTGDGSRPS